MHGATIRLKLQIELMQEIRLKPGTMLKDFKEFHYIVSILKKPGHSTFQTQAFKIARQNLK